MNNPFKRLSSFYVSRNAENLFSLEGAVPLSKSLPIALQHLLAMFFGNLTPVLVLMGMVSHPDPAVLENAIRSACFIAGLATLLQLYPIARRIGSGLPAIAGLSFTFVGVMGIIASQYGLSTMFVSIIIAGFVIGLFGLLAKFWVRFIKSIVGTMVVIALGLYLIQVGAGQWFDTSNQALYSANSAGVLTYDLGLAWPYILCGGLALVSSMAFHLIAKGAWKNLYIFVGLAVGYIAALFFPGMIDWSYLSFHSFGDFLNVPMPVFVLMPFGAESFNFGAIGLALLIFLVSYSESIGSFQSLGGALNREVTSKELAGGLAANGFVSAVAGVFGTLPVAIYAQNVGVTTQTKAINRFATLPVAIALILVAFFPPIAKFLLTVPTCVIGGCMIYLFASILVIGFQMLSRLGWTTKNTIIAALSLGIGYGVTLLPELKTAGEGNQALQTTLQFFQNPTSNAFLLSLLLSYVIPEEKKKD